MTYSSSGPLIVVKMKEGALTMCTAQNLYMINAPTVESESENANDLCAYGW